MSTPLIRNGGAPDRNGKILKGSNHQGSVSLEKPNAPANWKAFQPIDLSWAIRKTKDGPNLTIVKKVTAKTSDTETIQNFLAEIAEGSKMDEQLICEKYLTHLKRLDPKTYEK